MSFACHQGKGRVGGGRTFTIDRWHIYAACTIPSLIPKLNTDWPELLKDVIYSQHKKKYKRRKRNGQKIGGKPCKSLINCIRDTSLVHHAISSISES
jgi:hypothetical protein